MPEERFIPESQLIINDDGSAFHIHLTPSQLRKKIIMVGDPTRVGTVAGFFDSIDYDLTSREFHSIAGTYKGKEILCISHGIGADNIEIVLTELDALANIDFKSRRIKKNRTQLDIVRIGTSGGLQEDIKIGDYILAEKAIGFDGILNFYRDRDKVCDLNFQKEFCKFVNWDKTWATPYIVDADQELMERICKKEMKKGYTIASVGFYAPQGREVRLALKDASLIGNIEKFCFEKRPITNFEMESGALQGLSKLLGHRAVTVCCIIAQRVTEDAAPDYKPMLNELIKKVIERI